MWATLSAHCTSYTIPVVHLVRKNSSSSFEADIPHEDQKSVRAAMHAQSRVSFQDVLAARSRAENGKIVLTTPLFQLVTPKTLGRIMKGKLEGSQRKRKRMEFSLKTLVKAGRRRVPSRDVTTKTKVLAGCRRSSRLFASISIV